MRWGTLLKILCIMVSPASWSEAAETRAFWEGISAAIWAVLYIVRYRASSHSMRLDDSWGVGACVA